MNESAHLAAIGCAVGVVGVTAAGVPAWAFGLAGAAAAAAWLGRTVVAVIFRAPAPR
jgi:hypothetical protein